MSKYDYAMFWEVKGQEPAAAFDETKKGLIRNILNGIEYRNVLELGCGDGQLSQLIKEKSCHLTGLDISEDRLQMNNDLDAKLLLDITNESLLPVSDLIICSHFLLHIKPKDIEQVFENICKYSSKNIIFIEPNIKTILGDWEYYNFKHDYLELVKKNNLKVIIFPLSNFVDCYVCEK